MPSNSNTLEWLQNWCIQHSEEARNDDGIKIFTIDNPGWRLEIDVEDTELDRINIIYGLCETDENDWFGISLEEKKFKAAGDLNKLEFLLNKFRELTEHAAPVLIKGYLQKAYPGRWSLI